eukprot:350713-Chlamydomonas_euryale.AAC.2
MCTYLAPSPQPRSFPQYPKTCPASRHLKPDFAGDTIEPSRKHVRPTCLASNRWCGAWTAWNKQELWRMERGRSLYAST